MSLKEIEMKKFFEIFVTCILLITFCLSPLSASDNGGKLPIGFKIASDSIPKDGGTFNASVFVESNFGFYSEILYIFYPDCLKVESVSPVLPSDTFADNSPFYSSKDVLCVTNNSKSVTSKIKSVAESTGFSLEVGDISEFLASGYKYSVLYMTCEQTRDENGEEKQFMNFKSVDGKLADYTFSYDPSANGGETVLPIYVVPSNIDSLYIDTESAECKSVSFEPCGYVENARITEPSLYVQSETVPEGSQNVEISAFASFAGSNAQIEASLEIPPALNCESIITADGATCTLENGILSFETVVGEKSAELCEILKITFDTKSTPVGKYEIKFVSCKINGEGCFADGGTLTVEKACLSGGYHIYRKSKTDPSCTDDGYILLTCIKCGYSEKTDFEAATGHDFKIKSETEPTCDSFGVTVLKCRTCGLVEYSYSDPLEHSYVLTEHVDATETSEGYDTYTCEICSDTYTETLQKLIFPGDVNGDGVVSSKDCKIMKKFISNKIPESEIVFANADINGDGIISSRDLRLLKSIISKK